MEQDTDPSRLACQGIFSTTCGPHHVAPLPRALLLSPDRPPQQAQQQARWPFAPQAEPQGDCVGSGRESDRDPLPPDQRWSVAFPRTRIYFRRAPLPGRAEGSLRGERQQMRAGLQVRSCSGPAEPDIKALPQVPAPCPPSTGGL